MYTASRLGICLSAAFLAGASPAFAEDYADQTISATDDCSPLVGTGFRTEKLPADHPESIALRIGCELWNKQNAIDRADVSEIIRAETGLKEQIRQLQTRLNIYKNDNVILEVLPDLELDGDLGPLTADMLFGFVLDNNLYDFFVDTHKYDYLEAEKIYMIQFRDFLKRSAPKSFGQELQTLLQREIDQNMTVTNPAPLPPQQDVSCDQAGYERTKPCLERRI